MRLFGGNTELLERCNELTVRSNAQSKRIASLEAELKRLSGIEQRLRRLEQSDFLENREEYKRRQEALRRGSPGMALYPD